ncbi:MAG: TIGR00730 family Rossman fold protein [Hyphomicrobium sp.]
MTKPELFICVYCGSGHGKNPNFSAAAKILGRDLAKAGLGLVYGGGSLGLMGIIARSTLDARGYVTGIMPRFLIKREHMLKEINDLIITHTMHERKLKMFERSAAFVALPGGIGTLEELVEQLTWAQLGQHKKPIILANISNFWTPLLHLFQQMKDDAFIRRGLEVPFTILQDPHEIVPTLLEQLKKAPPKKLLSSVFSKL